MIDAEGASFLKGGILIKEFKLEVLSRSAISCPKWSIWCDGSQLPESDYVDWAVAAWLRKHGRLEEALESGVTLTVSTVKPATADMRLSRKCGDETWRVRYITDEFDDAPGAMVLCISQLRAIGFSDLDVLWVAISITKRPEPELKLAPGMTLIRRGTLPKKEEVKPKPNDVREFEMKKKLLLVAMDEPASGIYGDGLFDVTSKSKGKSWLDRRRRRMIETAVDITEMKLPKAADMLIEARLRALARDPDLRVFITKHAYLQVEALKKAESAQCPK